jgi:hypothetical protein
MYMVYEHIFLHLRDFHFAEGSGCSRTNQRDDDDDDFYGICSNENAISEHKNVCIWITQFDNLLLRAFSSEILNE